MISIEVTDTDSKDQTAVSWRCVAYGDIFELVPESTPGDLDPPLIQVAGAGKEIPIVTAHQAPKGYRYKKLNDAETEVTSDVVGKLKRSNADPQWATDSELIVQILLDESIPI